MTFSFKFAREIGGGAKNVVVVVVVPFFYPFSSFSTQFPRLRSAFGLASLGNRSTIFTSWNEPKSRKLERRAPKKIEQADCPEKI